jgi:predicted ArsR family transcriptional regulator
MTSEELLEALGKKYSAAILEATDVPRSAQELSDQLGVPIATCYRRIHELTEHGLLEVHEDSISEDSRRIKIYRRNVDAVRVDFENSVTVDLEGDARVTSKLDKMWEQSASVAG